MPSADELRAGLAALLTVARKAGDRDTAAAVRSAIGAIDNAEAVPDPGTSMIGDGPIAGALAGLGASEVARRELTDDEVAAAVEDEIADLDTSADEYERLGRPERSVALRAGAAALRSILSRPR